MAMLAHPSFPLELLAEGVASVAPDGVLTAQNGAMRSLLAASGGDTLSALVVDAADRARLDTGAAVVVAVGGRPFELVLHGDTAARWCVARDVAARERVEAVELAAARLRLLAGQAASIVHDFNNLLGSTVGLASLLVTNTANADERRLLEELQRGSQRTATLVRGLARLLQLTPRRWQTVPVTDLVDEATALVRRIAVMQSTAWETTGATQLPPIRVVPAEVSQQLVQGFVTALDRRPQRVVVDATTLPLALAGGRQRPCVRVRVAATDCALADGFEAAEGVSWHPLAALVMARMGGALDVTATAGELTIDYVWPAAGTA